MSLDYFNLHLADYELTTEAFAAFRSKQLQAPRSFILDPSSAAPFLSEEPDVKPSSFLDDLHVVSVFSCVCVCGVLCCVGTCSYNKGYKRIYNVHCIEMVHFLCSVATIRYHVDTLLMTWQFHVAYIVGLLSLAAPFRMAQWEWLMLC